MTDYDLTDIPTGYDRARDHGPEVLDLWMREVAECVGDRTIASIVDLGCGTGRFTEGLASKFDADVIGLDPSARMLGIARQKQRNPRVHYVLGRAEMIPLPRGSIDLVFLSMSMHHFTDQDVAARECRRVLSREGCVVIRTGSREQIPSYPYVPFFATSPPLLEATLPAAADVVALFTATGLHHAGSRIIQQTIARDWGAYADKLAAGGDSVLARLNPQEFEAGLAGVRRFAATSGRQPVVEPIDLFVFSVRAPGLAE